MHSINNVLAASVLALFASTAQGHMVMATPPPYGSPDNSPLSADGSNFPCKATSNSGATITDMAIGAPQKLSFLGESVHGGGSCQVSLTTDNPATKSSTWMVIHSIEGGCPAKGVAGNLGADNSASAPDPDTYSFAIPEGIKPGAYTLAWTWFNKVGNREMYMNCASIKVTGGSNKRDHVPCNETAMPELAGRDTPSFPPMFVANIPVSDCTTADSKDVQFPNPGASVEKDGVASDLAPPTGPKCGSASGSSSSGSQAAAPSGGAAAAPSVAASPAAAAPSVAGSPAAAAPSVAGSPAAAAPSVAASPASPASSAPAAPAPAAPSAASPATGSTSSSSGSSSSGSSSGTCSSPGAMICSPDGKSFAICSSGGAAPVFQPVSAGTSCANGAIAAVKGKRWSAKFARGY